MEWLFPMIEQCIDDVGEEETMRILECVFTELITENNLQPMKMGIYEDETYDR